MILLLNFHHRITSLFLLLLVTGCDSRGQNEYSSWEDWHLHNQIPAQVIQSLPPQPDSLTRTPHFQFFSYGEISQNNALQLAQDAEDVLQKIRRFTQSTLPLPEIKWFLYPSPEIKGLKLKNSAPCQIDFENHSIHYILNNHFKDYYRGQENELALALLLGSPRMPVLQKGLAIYFSESWQKTGYRHWAAVLTKAGATPSLTSLLNEETWRYGSEPILGSFAAAFCEFLIHEMGKDAFLHQYVFWHPEPQMIADLDEKWQAYLLDIDIDPHTNQNQKLPFLKGFNFAHEGYRIYNGYGSRKADQALQSMHRLGVNTVAVVPYTFIRDPKKAGPIPVVKQPGTENDESVIQSAESAQSEGLQVVMKPQIWLGGGNWTGDINMSSESEWEQFFHYYGHWITHYAVLAEIYEWNLLCLGNELVHTTLQREKNWRELIRSIRQVYHGPITYAANWGDEFEKTRFWDQLDFIGLNCYYPLSHKDDPSNKELEKGFRNITRKIEQVQQKFRKPLIFTEIGFPSIHAPWKKPHEDWGNVTHNSEHQKRCYEIVFQGLKDKNWCKGILWWKYPSDLDHHRKRNTGFSPHGNPAEGVVAKWFQFF